jgi:hypothetical protein
MRTYNMGATEAVVDRAVVVHLNRHAAVPHSELEAVYAPVAVHHLMSVYSVVCSVV